MRKRMIAFLTVAALAVSLFSTTAYAAEDQTGVTVEAVYEEADAESAATVEADETDVEDESAAVKEEEEAAAEDESDDAADTAADTEEASDDTESETDEVATEYTPEKDLTDVEEISSEESDTEESDVEKSDAEESDTEESEAEESDTEESEADESDAETVVNASSTTASGSCGTSTTWALSSDGTLTISGSGAMTDYSSYSSAPWYSYRSSISAIVVSSGITAIGDYAFCYTDAETVSLPSSLLTIGEAAFYGSYSLTSITIPDKVTTVGTAAFANCTSLTSITLGSKVSTINGYAFQNTGISSLTIPAAVSSIGTEICYGCKSLTTYSVNSGNSTYASANGVLFSKDKTTLIRCPLGKSGSYSVPSTVKTIDDYAFYQCTNLTGITLTSTVTTIGDWAFDACTGLTSMTIPDSVTSIGYGIFDSCTALKTAKIGSGVETLEYRTFYGCTALTKVTLSKGLKTIDNWAFYNCTALKSLTVPSSVTSVSAYAFKNCTNLTVSYPSSLTKMEDDSYKLVATVKLSGTYNYTYAYQVLKLVNEEREEAGLSALTMNEDLLAAAMQRAAEYNLYFSHTRPSGLDCFTVSSKASGENIAVGQSSASAVMTSWMNSSGHKANILGSSYQSIGIGCFTQGGTIYWVQLFGTGEADTLTKPSNTSKTVTVKLDPEIFEDCLYLYASTTSLKTGKSTTLKARVTNPGWSYAYAELKGSSLSWSSGNTSIATVSSSGKVTAKGAGTAKITAKTNKGGLSASVKIKSALATPTISKVSNTSSGIKVKWGKVTGASGYYVYRKTGSSGSYKKIATIKSGSSLSYTNKTSGSYKVSTGKTYYYKVVAYSGSSKSSKSSAAKMVRLASTSISSVKNTSAKKMTVKWSKKSGVTGYQVQYATNSDFTSGKTTKTYSGASTVKKTISGLKKGKTYYVRIRTYKTVSGTKYYSAWSSSKKVKITK